MNDWRPIRTSVETRIPMRTDVALTAVPFVFGYDLQAMLGTAQDGAPVVILSFDIPSQVRDASSKTAQELSDLSDFASRAYPDFRPDLLSPVTPDPPDAILQLGPRTVRLEAAQLHPPKYGPQGVTSMSAWSAFEKSRAELIEQSGRLAPRLWRHRGYTLVVWFNEDAQSVSPSSLPPRLDPAAGLRDLLLSCRPPTDWQETSADDLTVWNTNGTIGLSWAYLPRSHGSAVTRALGFELALAYSRTITRADVRAELRRLIESHDSPAADVLVLSGNAPLRSGLYFPSAELICSLAMNDPDPLQGWSPQHLPSVALHDVGNPEVPVRWLVGDGL